MSATRYKRRSPIVLAAYITLAGYALWSGAAFFTTADRCGELRAEKHWEPWPPGWVCGPR